VIIPAFNSAGTMAACLNAVRACGYDDYECLVVDDGSSDATADLAGRLADRVLKLDRNHGRSHARNTGARAARGDILVFVDSDILIRPDTLLKIAEFFDSRPAYDALTGLLAPGHPGGGFFSRYKNIYMNFRFRRLRSPVTFLYGGICAVRRQAWEPFDCRMDSGEDTELGQRLVSSGKLIGFCADLEVVHAKQYGLFSLLKNDWRVPFSWAGIFVRRRGWRQFRARPGRGFAHAPLEQLVSVILAPLIVAGSAVCWGIPGLISFTIVLTLVWGGLNLPFLVFLCRQTGLLSGLAGIVLTLLDQTAMAAGILGGFAFSGKQRGGGS